MLESAQKYLSTLHKVSDILSRAASVEALFDSILSAILEVAHGDRAAILMRNTETNDVDMIAVRTRDGKASGAVKVSRSVVNDVLEKGISSFTDDALADERYVGGESIGDAVAIAGVAFAIRLPLGLALGWLWVRRRSLLATIVLHAAYNAILVLASTSV